MISKKIILSFMLMISFSVFGKDAEIDFSATENKITIFGAEKTKSILQYGVRAQGVIEYMVISARTAESVLLIRNVSNSSGHQTIAEIVINGKVLAPPAPNANAVFCSGDKIERVFFRSLTEKQLLRFVQRCDNITPESLKAFVVSSHEKTKE